MKSKIFRHLALPMSLGILLSGCSADNVMSELDKPVERDTDFYINVKIATPSEDGTRADGTPTNTNTAAGDYVNGTADEQKIHKILFVFYNSAYEYVGNYTYDPAVGQTSVDSSTAGTIESIMNLTVPVSVAAGSTKPAYVIAYVNPTRKAENDLFNDFNTAIGAFRTLDDVREIKTGDKKHDGFSMNNSVHYEAENSNELPMIAVPIKEEQLFTSKEEAEKAVSSAPVVIYVERIVAKVTLGLEDNIPVEDNTISDDSETPAGYTLDFNILGWGLSNLERYTFLIKNFRTDTDGNPESFDGLMEFNNFTYGTLDARLDDNSDPYKSLNNPHWNYPGNTTSSDDGWSNSGHRSFWALSPTYYPDNVAIPKIADDIYYADNAGEDPRVHQNESSLIYRSFNDIYNTGTTPMEIGKHGKGFGDSQYTLEHTMQAALITNYQKRAVTCAVVVGQYDLKKSDGTKVTYDNFYIRKKLSETGYVSVIYPSDKDMKTAYLNANSTIYVKNGNDYVAVKGESYFGDFEIYHPRKDITGDSGVASRYVTIRLANIEGKEYYHLTSTGAYEKIDSENLLAANQDLYTNMIGMLGGIEMYKDGYAYFEIPVKHLWARAGDKEIGDKDFHAKLGQYGIVRNHAYNLKVQKIKGIGTGISDPDAPIVPNYENDDYVVKTEIRVQRWRIVPTQNVTLRP